MRFRQINNIDGAEVQFGSPTLQSSNQGASRNRGVFIKNKQSITSGPALHHGAIFLVHVTLHYLFLIIYGKQPNFIIH